MKKLTEKQIQNILTDFDNWFEARLLSVHEEIYADEPNRIPVKDPELVDEYCDARSEASDVLYAHLKNWGTFKGMSVEELDSCKLSSKGYPRNNKLLRADAIKALNDPDTKKALKKLQKYFGLK